MAEDMETRDLLYAGRGWDGKILRRNRLTQALNFSGWSTKTSKKVAKEWSKKRDIRLEDKIEIW